MPKAYINTHVAHISDTTDSNAQSKIRSAYARHLGDNGIRDVILEITPATNTLDIGFKASELLTNTQRARRLLLALNCAPPDNDKGTKDNARNDFYFADLGDDAFAGGTVNGFELSYVKNSIRGLFRLASTNKLGSQFRSLEILPEHLSVFSNTHKPWWAILSRTAREELIKSGDLVPVEHVDDVVPSAPDVTHAVEIDNFQNIKLFLSQADRKAVEANRKLRIILGGDSLGFDQICHQLKDSFDVAATEKLFDAPLGTNLIALNSSSVLPNGNSVPIIATIRKRPGETSPNYPVPDVGSRVKLELAA